MEKITKESDSKETLINYSGKKKGGGGGGEKREEEWVSLLLFICFSCGFVVVGGFFSLVYWGFF